MNSFIIALARALVAGEQSEMEVVRRAEAVVGKRRRWIAPLARRYLDAFASGTRPRHRDVIRFLQNDERFDAALLSARRGETGPLEVREWLVEPHRMQPAPGAAGWRVPAIETVGALAEWFGVTGPELEWFADVQGRTRRDAHSRLHHYHYRIVEKRSGGVRLIEAPQARLKTMQRRILTDILDAVPSFHDAAHGFVKGRSIRTFAAPHAGQHIVLRLDIKDFFPSVSGARVQAAFRTIGYPEAVADVLGGICTNIVPRSVWHAKPTRSNVRALHDLRTLYGRPHLPQGAPTSPALANFCAYRLDCRLTGLADWAGGVYTRYGDDLAFSGGREIARSADRYAAQIGAIVLEEGWSVQYRKTRVMTQSVRQHLVGLVVNERVNVSRGSRDELKAILTNCVRHGPASQNREGHPAFRQHLEGRIAFVSSVDVVKGARLRAIFDRIVWE